MAGRSIRLFLVDGTPQGIRTAEVGNWTGLALVGPRTELARLQQRPEVTRTGVYLLIGPSETSASSLAAYVGEGDEVWTRIRSHDADLDKDWWTWVVVFVSKDYNLTKAHVRWLEARLVGDLRAARRAEIKNGTNPVGGRLPEADEADMATFLENVRLLLPTLGANVFSVEAPSQPAQPQSRELVLELKWDEASAECVVRDGQFVVTAGSTARTTEVDSLANYLRELRRKLRDTGVLTPVLGNDRLFRFPHDYAFDSPSTAAGAITGTGLNGRTHWKVKGEGSTYKEWLDRRVQQVDAQADRAPG